jgi:chromosome segregation ATPase
MNMLKTFASAFVELDEDKTAKPTVAQPVVQGGIGQSQTGQSQPTSTAYAVNSQYDPDMIAALQKVIASRKTPYTALVEAADKLKQFIPDDVTRFKAAYAQIAGDGVRTVGNIASAIDVHINDLNGEQMRFKQSSDAQVNSKVGNLRSTVESIVSQNAQRQQQIANLQAQIATMNQSIVDDTAKASDLTNQANAAEADIAAVAQRFQAAADYLKQDLTNKKAQLTSALAA